MIAGHAFQKRLKFPLVVQIALLFGGTLCSCTPPASFMGIRLAPGLASADLQNLAWRARAGDKKAQLDLGMRFEEGRGVPYNRRHALTLYERAAVDTGPSLAMFSPAVNGKDSGQVIYGGRAAGAQKGLEEARIRHRRLRDRRAR